MSNETEASSAVAAMIAMQLRELIGVADRAGPDFDLLAHLLGSVLAEADRIGVNGSALAPATEV